MLFQFELKNWSPFTAIVLDLAATLFTPQLQKCFVDSKTSPTHPIGIDNEWIFIFEWTIPLSIIHKKTNIKLH